MKHICPECGSKKLVYAKKIDGIIFCSKCDTVLKKDGSKDFEKGVKEKLEEREAVFKMVKMMSNLKAKALILATWVHSGVKDKGGDDYINHPVRVSQNVRGSTEVCIAIMHDVLEDSEGHKKITREDLLELGFNIYIVEGVESVTRIVYEDGTKEDYFDFIRRCCKNDAGRSVKKSDIGDNMDEDRLHYLSEKFRNKLVTKYTKARHIISHYEVYGELLEN